MQQNKNYLPLKEFQWDPHKPRGKISWLNWNQEIKEKPAHILN